MVRQAETGAGPGWVGVHVSQIERDDSDAFSHLSLGQKLLEEGSLDRAEQELLRSLESDASFSIAFALLALCYERGGDKNAARGCLQRGVQETAARQVPKAECLRLSDDHAEGERGGHAESAGVSDVRGGKRLKILYVVHETPRTNLGGSGLYTHHLAQEMVNRGHEVRILYPERVEDVSCARIETVREQGICLDGLVSPEPRGLLAQLQFENSGVEAFFKEYIEKERFDLIHFQHFIGLPLSLARVARDCGVPTVMTLHDFWTICHTAHLMKNQEQLCLAPENIEDCVDCWVNTQMDAETLPTNPDGQAFLGALLYCSLPFRRRYARDLLRSIDRILAPSRFVAETFEQWGVERGRIEVLPLGTYSLPRLPSEKRQRVHFSFLGHAIPVKGLHFLLEALQSVKGDAYLFVHGNIYDQRCHEMIARMDNVFVMGPYQHDELPAILANTDVTVVPSVMESFSFVVRESLSQGVPVLASRVGGIPEAIADGENGLLFEAGDVASLARTMNRLTTNRSEIDRLRHAVRPPKSTVAEAGELECLYGDLVVRQSRQVAQ